MTKAIKLSPAMVNAYPKAKGKRWRPEWGAMPSEAALAAASYGNRAGTAVHMVHAILLRAGNDATPQVAADIAAALLGAKSTIHVNALRKNMRRGLYVALDANGKRIAADNVALGKVETVRLALPAKPASKPRKPAAKATAAKPATEPQASPTTGNAS